MLEIIGHAPGAVADARAVRGHRPRLRARAGLHRAASRSGSARCSSPASPWAPSRRSAAPPALVSSIGLVMFLYGIGIQYGRQFFAGLERAGAEVEPARRGRGAGRARGRPGARRRVAGVSPAYSMGLFAGSLTSTPTLQAAIDAAGNGDPAIGYSVAYPFGVIGPILCLFALRARSSSRGSRPRPRRCSRSRSPSATPAAAHRRRAHRRAAARRGSRRRPAGRRRTGCPIRRPASRPATASCCSASPMRSRRPGSRSAASIRAASRRTAALWTSCGCSCRGRRWSARRSARPRLPGRASSPRSPRCAAATPCSSPPPTWCSSTAIASASIAPREAIPSLRKHFGDSLKSTAEFSYVSVGLGMSLGVLLGLVDDPDPGRGLLLARARRRPAPRRARSSAGSAGPARSPGTSRSRRTSRCATSG